MWIIIQIYPNSISLILDYISLAENDIIFNNSQTKINLYLLNFFFFDQLRTFDCDFSVCVKIVIILVAVIRECFAPSVFEFHIAQ